MCCKLGVEWIDEQSTPKMGGVEFLGPKFRAKIRRGSQHSSARPGHTPCTRHTLRASERERRQLHRENATTEKQLVQLSKSLIFEPAK